MKKKIVIGLVAVGITTSSVAYDYQIKEGWQQLGAIEDINDLTVFNDTCVNTVMRYDNKNKNRAMKKIYIANSDKKLSKKLRLKRIKKAQGFEVVAHSNCVVSVNSEEKENNEIVFNGIEYKKIVSPNTGKVWLDRNLGAQNVCDSSIDSSCFGDYYQWGRLSDMHEKLGSSTTSTPASDISDSGKLFVIGTDWANVDPSGVNRKSQWEITDGSGICPVGFRVPEIEELNNEYKNYTEFNNDFLKTPLSGFHNLRSGGMTYVNSTGYLWSNSFSSIGTASDSQVFTTTSSYSGPTYWAHGFPVRCIED